MVNVTELRPGNYYIWENNLYLCIDIDLNKTAMAKMKVKVKSKNMRSGAILEMSFIGGDKVDIVRLEKKQMQYLYDDGESLVLMDTESYEQINLDKKKVEWEMNFLVPEQVITITFFEGEVMGVELPAKVVLKITQCEPAVRGDTINIALKDAYLETGFKVRVPIFVEQGELINVFTADGTYDSRAK